MKYFYIILFFCSAFIGYLFYQDYTEVSIDEKIVEKHEEIAKLKKKKGVSMATLSKSTADLGLAVVVFNKEIVKMNNISDSIREKEERLKTLVTLSELNDKALRE